MVVDQSTLVTSTNIWGLNHILKDVDLAWRIAIALNICVPVICCMVLSMGDFIISCRRVVCPCLLWHHFLCNSLHITIQKSFSFQYLTKYIPRNHANSEFHRGRACLTCVLVVPFPHQLRLFRPFRLYPALQVPGCPYNCELHERRLLKWTTLLFLWRKVRGNGIGRVNRIILLSGWNR